VICRAIVVDDSTGISWESVYTISLSWVDVLIVFTSFCLESCIRPDAISRWIRQRNSSRFCVNLGKSVTETLAMVMTVLGKRKVESMLIIFFHIKGIVRQVFFQAAQAVNSAHYCVGLRRLHENVRRLPRSLVTTEPAVRSWQHTKNNMHVAPAHPPYFICLPN
jgi:hypothetical protein